MLPVRPPGTYRAVIVRHVEAAAAARSGVFRATNRGTSQLGVRETRSERRIVRRPPLGTKMERRATGKSVSHKRSRV